MGVDDYKLPIDCDREYQLLHANLRALQTAYSILGNIHYEWTGRNTVAGQSFLAGMRDLIAEQTCRDPCEVQDDYTNRPFL